MSTEIILSIVTVCYNDLENLRKTIQSIQSTKELRRIELLIIDGNSKDGTKEYLSSLTLPYNFRFISEPDNGIYDAMNKGIEQAIGQYIWFLNSGDFIFDHQTIDTLISNLYQDGQPIIFYGKSLVTGRNYSYISGTNKIPKHMLSLPTCHQAIVYPKEFILGGYDTGYKLVADLKLTLKLYFEDRKFHFLNYPIAIYNLNGVSSNSHWKELIERKKIIFDIIPIKYRIISCIYLCFLYIKYSLILILKEVGIYHHLNRLFKT